MIQEYIEKNRDTIAILAKWMMIAGWVLLITTSVILPFSVIRLSLASNIWSSLSFVAMRIISPVSSGLLLLVLGQFLRYELGLEKQAGWFLRNGVIILRVYAAIIIGFLILHLAGAITAIPRISKQPLASLGLLNWIVLDVVKVLLLWGAVSMLKMMTSGTRENTRPNV